MPGPYLPGDAFGGAARLASCRSGAARTLGRLGQGTAASHTFIRGAERFVPSGLQLVGTEGVPRWFLLDEGGHPIRPCKHKGHQFDITNDDSGSSKTGARSVEVSAKCQKQARLR